MQNQSKFRVCHFWRENSFRSGAHALHNLTIIIEQKNLQMPVQNFFSLRGMSDHASFNEKKEKKVKVGVEKFSLHVL